MDIFFTICSKNYLAQAITLNQSFKKFYSNERFVIALVDHLNDEEVKMIKEYDVIYSKEIFIEETESFYQKYDVVELNTAFKPYYIDYFFKAGYQKVVYLDPDTYLYAPLDPVINNLDKYNFILTPHFFTPINDDKILNEQITLITGTFNLGFFAVRNNEIGQKLINWWKVKLFDGCLSEPSNGYFVDQKWMNLSISLFDGFLIDKNPGLNMAHWNLHERYISVEESLIKVNKSFPLIFYHFSSYRPLAPKRIAEHQNRFTFESRPDIVPLYNNYLSEVLNNGYSFFSKLKPFYGRKQSKKEKYNRLVKLKISNLIDRLIKIELSA